MNSLFLNPQGIYNNVLVLFSQFFSIFNLKKGLANLFYNVLETNIFSFAGHLVAVTEDSDCNPKIKRHLLLGKKSYDQPRQYIKKQRHYFADKGLYSQSYDFSSSHI